MADTITHPIFSLQDTITTLTPLELLLSRQNSSVTPLESLKKSITENTLPSLLAKPNSLLLKRHSSLDFDDLLVKKVKTQSTNYSDCGSRQQSFISQEKIESDDKDDDNSSLFEENFSIEGLTIVDPSSKGLFYIPPLEEMRSQPTIPMLVESNISDSRTLLQQSLENLKSQFIFSQLKDLLFQNLFPTQSGVQVQAQPVRIPPFVGASATNSKTDSETVIPPFKELNRLPKKVEEELAVTYGAVEFPFLSLSTEFDNAHNSRSHFVEMENSLPLIPMNMNLMVQEDKQKKQKKTAAVFKIQKTDKVQESVMERKKISTTKENKEIKVQKTEKKIFQESKKVFPIVKKPSPNKSKDIPVPAFINLAEKTVKKPSVKADNKMEIEEEKEAPKRKRSYSFLRFGKRRGEERKKNRWQVSQDEKLGDLLLASIQNLSNNHSMMFEGIKKKGVQVPLGDEHQVDMKSSIVDCKRENPREPRLKWDPSVHKEADMQRYFKDASAIVDSEINQEILIGYLLKNLNDITKAKKHIKANKGKIAQELILKTLE